MGREPRGGGREGRREAGREGKGVENWESIQKVNIYRKSAYKPAPAWCYSQTHSLGKWMRE